MMFFRVRFIIKNAVDYLPGDGEQIRVILETNVSFQESLKQVLRVVNKDLSHKLFDAGGNHLFRVHENNL